MTFKLFIIAFNYLLFKLKNINIFFSLVFTNSLIYKKLLLLIL